MQTAIVDVIPAGNNFGNRNGNLKRVDVRGFSLRWQAQNLCETPICLHFALVTPLWGTTQISDITKQTFRDPAAYDQQALDFSSATILANYNLLNVLPLSSAHFTVHFHKKYILQARTLNYTTVGTDTGRTGKPGFGLEHRYGKIWWRNKQRYWVNETQAGKNANPVLAFWCSPMETTSASATAGITIGYQSRTYFNQN